VGRNEFVALDWFPFCISKGAASGNMTNPPTIEIIPASALTAAQRQTILNLCSAAYAEDFGSNLDLMAEATHVIASVKGQWVSHAAWVTRWLQPAGQPLLRTAYVEAVATLPTYQGRGLGSAVLRQLAAAIADFDLGGLSPSEPAYYARLGWVLWQGPLAIRTAQGLLDTPGEHVMILALPSTPTLDRTSLLTAEWREGELW
jgi:aminoglycoside 2'-N-acetyltransferase I